MSEKIDIKRMFEQNKFLSLRRKVGSNSPRDDISQFANASGTPELLSRTAQGMYRNRGRVGFKKSNERSSSNSTTRKPLELYNNSPLFYGVRGGSISTVNRETLHSGRESQVTFEQPTLKCTSVDERVK